MVSSQPDHLQLVGAFRGSHNFGFSWFDSVVPSRLGERANGELGGTESESCGDAQNDVIWCRCHLSVYRTNQRPHVQRILRSRILPTLLIGNFITNASARRLIPELHVSVSVMSPIRDERGKALVAIMVAITSPESCPSMIVGSAFA